MFLQRYLPNMRFWGCDIDETMLSVARTHFCFKCNSRSNTIVGDGIELICKAHSRLSQSCEGSYDDALNGLDSIKKFDFICIDVDSKE